MTSTQNNLFDDSQAPVPEEFRGDLVAQAASQASSPLQREFARLLRAIDANGQKVQNLEQLFATYRGKFINVLGPMEDQVIALQKQLIVALHERLQQARKPKDLNPKQRKAIERFIIEMSEQMVQDEGDAQMQVIHDVYSPDSIEDKEQEDTDELREMLDNMGVPLDDLPSNAPTDVLLKRLKDSTEQSQKEYEALQAKRAEKAKAKRAAQAKTDPKLQAKLAAQQESEQNAQSALRTLYRQLARQLHPDRAGSDSERETNNDLMSQVNTAYERQDLLALLKLQLRAQQIDAAGLHTAAEEKLLSWNKLLRVQAKQLEQDLREIQMQMAVRFGLVPFDPLSENILEQQLKTEIEVLEEELEYCRADLQDIQTDTGLKRWIKEQQQSDNELEQGPVGLASMAQSMAEMAFHDLMRQTMNQSAPKKRR